MSYKVIKPLVIVPNDDGVSGDGYFYKNAVIPDGFNDERCEVLAKDGMLEKVKTEKPAEGKALTKGSSKADWVAFATDDARGEGRLSAEDAEALTRDELAEKFATPA